MKTTKRERKITGLAACLKLLERRADDVIRLYVTEATLPRFKGHLRALATAKKAYHVVTDEELRTITESTHHEGVCVLARESTPPGLGTVLASLPTGRPASVLYLENVANPHNVGAIVRVAAHFGALAVLVDAAGETRAAVGSAAMARTAEGGAEVVPVIPVEDRKAMLAALVKAGFSLVATSSHANRGLFGAPLPARACLLLGSESSGLGETLSRAATLTLAIPGTGDVESLNVATAAASLLTEFYRQHLWSLKPGD